MDPADRFEDCFAPGCVREPKTYIRAYKSEPIQVLPACKRHSSAHPTLDPARLETFLTEQNAKLVAEIPE